MNIEIHKHCIHHSKSLIEALELINRLGTQLTLFVLKDNDSVFGTITDGDIRRALLNNIPLDANIKIVMNKDFVFLNKYENNIQKISFARKEGKKLIPIVDKSKKIVKLIDLTITQTILPLTAVIMAGGKGERLRPLTNTVPKPMLTIGRKPIIEHNIDSLIKYGIEDIYISVNYLADQIIDYFGDGSKKNVSIKYLYEDKPMGTIGSISQIKKTLTKDILLLNSDILTNIDYEEFYNKFTIPQAEMCIASIPHIVNIPFAILETQKNRVFSLIEKPTYNYIANAGIYLIRKDNIRLIPNKTKYDATDLIEKIILKKGNITNFPITGYWLDIGTKDEYMKAKEQIKFVKM